MLRQISWLIVAISVFMNTLPIWIAELVTRYEMAASFAGAIATSFCLLVAVFCLIKRLHIRQRLLNLVFVCCIMGAIVSITWIQGLVPFVVPFLLVAVCLGLRLTDEIARLRTMANFEKGIGDSVATGMLLSFLILVSSGFFATSTLLIVLLVCLSAASQPPATKSTEISPPNLEDWKRHTPYFLFFASMGAFWATIELHSVAQKLPSMATVLGFSLLVSAVGSASAVKFGARTSLVFLVISALSASGIFLSGSFWLITLLVMTNSFALFTLLPKYVSGFDNFPEQATNATAIYLLGFSVGGLLGGGLFDGLGPIGLAAVCFGLSVPAGMQLLRLRRCNPI